MLNIEIARLEAVPEVVSDALDKVETEARARLCELRELFADHPQRARAALERLVDAPLTLHAGSGR